MISHQLLIDHRLVLILYQERERSNSHGTPIPHALIAILLVLAHRKSALLFLLSYYILNSKKLNSNFHGNYKQASKPGPRCYIFKLTDPAVLTLPLFPLLGATVVLLETCEGRLKKVRFHRTSKSYNPIVVTMYVRKTA